MTEFNMEMDTHNYWEENVNAVKYEKYNDNTGSEEFPRSAGCSDQLNFSTPLSGDEAEGTGYMKKGKQDPMSHRIIEKRRRDRMNNCLADLSRLVPTQYMKKGRGRVEKTEIIEMAIKHIKFLQDRAYAAEQRVANESAEHYRAGFQEALTEALRFLVQVQGYTPDDGLCLKMAAQLHGHCEHLTKGDVPPRVKGSCNVGSGNTTENNSSSSGYSREEYPKPTVIARTEVPEKTAYREPFQQARTMETAFTLQCDNRGAEDTSRGNSSDEPLPLDGRRKREHNLRTACNDDNDDYLQSYKFKNSIERRFSKSQDPEVHDMSMRSGAHPNKVYTHKRRRVVKPAEHDSTTPPTSTTTSNSGSTEEARDTSPQCTSSDSHHENYDKTTEPTQYVPVFALNSYGKYYVPLTVDAACLSRHHGSYDGVLMSHPEHQTTPLHPVTIHVNFQPCLDYHVKKEPAEREWAP